MMNELEIKNIVKPETSLEKIIVNDLEWIEGALWGMVRQGHPEGKVIFHIREVLDNIEKLNSNKETREKLRILALIHDTFKYKVDITKPRVGNNNHAVIARQFAEKLDLEKPLLDIIEFHDEAFNCWRKGNDTGNWNKAMARLEKLLLRIKGIEDLYYLFFKCDNNTGDKQPDSFLWFEKKLESSFQ